MDPSEEGLADRRKNLHLSDEAGYCRAGTPGRRGAAKEAQDSRGRRESGDLEGIAAARGCGDKA